MVIGKTLLRRLIQALLVAFIVGSLCFWLARLLPGDMAYQIGTARFGEDLTSQQAVEAVRTELRLDQPVLSAWLSWMADLARLDLGRSYVHGTPIWSLIKEQLGNTIILSATALGLSCLIGLPIGIIAGIRRGGAWDRTSLVLSVLLRATPPFVIAILLMIVFAIELNWLPVAGHTEPGSIVLPALTLALGLAAVSSRIARSAMADVAASDYFEFAQTKGLSLRRTALAHGLRNVAIPIITHLGMQLVFLVEGVLVVETLFAWPGIGHALTHAVSDRDVPMLQGTALAMALLFVLLNMAVDLAALAIDPRLRK